MAAVSIAFEAPDNCGGAPVTGKKPIDFDHLARQTMGDKDLEIEVLQLFSRNARAALHEMAGAGDTGVKATAHRLKGAAQAVGAFDVSVAAAAVEAGGNDSAAIAKLAAAIVEAENFILKLCR
ncbi:Hpt domain-containing protein [Agrobacterium pusense]|uniref:HPt domain-containing protein n=1 Tax=Agrobacterium pusense TaxID=648995 RepID=U4Q3G2_9HYPH|nr:MULTISPECIES: Hpt domain-containing protein [Agrobacterium]MCW8283142.1 Hpt domain-containing protein [Agrobacterium sp. InxBP2]MDH0113499.1 Hpt domain-containing protein [Agrobacterium pusense]MRG64719.1 Hpt domain-containing protein [Agrobacterium pusense]QCL84086.1 Hpt domain-containing protein [Agrobacterium pusense]RAL96183.1 Hpt domain-containing protein [Agrobacterium sp. MS2]